MGQQLAQAANGIQRRQLLKAAGVVAGSGALQLSVIPIAEAKQSKYYLGERRLIETKVEYPDSQEGTLLTRSNLAPYVVDSNWDRVTLTGASPEPFKQDEVVVSTGRRFVGTTEEFTLHNLKQHIVVKGDFRRLRSQFRVLDSQMDVPGGIIETEQDGNITAVIEDHEMNIAPGTVDSIELPPRRITHFSPDRDENDSEIVTPKVTVRNNGKLDVFGSSRFRILPMASDDDYAQRRISSLMYSLERDESSGIIKKSEDKLLLVPQGGN